MHATEKVADWPAATGPLARFFGGATTIVFDNLAQTLTIAARDGADVDRAADDLGGTAKLRHVAVPDRARIPSDFEVSIDDERFMTMVERAKEYIAAGDAFQIVLARTFSVPQGGRDPFDVYRAMRVINPSPYMYSSTCPPRQATAPTPRGRARRSSAQARRPSYASKAKARSRR